MVFVLTNDDGIDAPGLRSLVQSVKNLNLDAVIAAPQEHLSGCGHQVTTTSPIRVHKRSEREYAIAGTPADCVRIAISHLCPTVHWVLSGINSGGNLGADVYISGTVAAVREAALHRISGIAFSQYRHGRREIDWDFASYLVTNVLTNLLARPTQPGVFWNVNLPHLATGASDPKLVFCTPCTQPLPAVYRVNEDQFHYAGEYSQRRRDPGGDVEVCFNGHIAITQLQV
ncbi:MAG: 5'/3'-nucleotidase SurE [Oscillatoriales cyanobacterium C42_A2020_001]|nr:5'/3'-nucleotidase SurE [Leptolyngbyaceae cyanobacterium C42_A2020_001]